MINLAEDFVGTGQLLRTGFHTDSARLFYIASGTLTNGETKREAWTRGGMGKFSVRTNTETRINLDVAPGIYFFSAVSNVQRMTGKIVVQ